MKSICTNKVRPIDINDAASSADRRKCVFEPVRGFRARECVWSGSLTLVSQ